MQSALWARRLWRLSGLACCGSGAAYCDGPAPTPVRSPAQAGRSGPPSGYKLVSAHVVFRHGARTPVFVCPGLEGVEWPVCRGVNGPPAVAGDGLPALPGVTFAQLHTTDITGNGKRPHSTADARQAGTWELKGGCRAGQLTDLGATQAAALGRELRRRYGVLLDPAGSTVDARSTNVARCVATLSAVLGAMLPEARGAIDVRIQSSKLEDLTPNVGACPRMAELMSANRSRWVGGGAGEGAAAFAGELEAALDNDAQAEALGLRELNFVRLRDWVVALEAHGLPVPFRLSELQVDTLDVLGARQVAAYMGWRTEGELPAVKAGIGHLLQSIAGDFSAAERRLRLTSAHDTTVLPLLIALGIYDGLWPPFCANVAIELWEDQSRSEVSLREAMTRKARERFLVRVVYNGEEATRMSLPRFVDFVKSRQPDRSWEHECHKYGSGERPGAAAPAGGSHW